MKKPLFDQVERKVIIQFPDSFSAGRMKMLIAQKKIGKAFMQTYVGRFVLFLVNKLDKYLS